MITATVHQGVESVHKTMLPLEFVRTHWEEYRVVGHDDVPFVTLLKEYNLYVRRDVPGPEYWVLQTGLYKLEAGGARYAGNRAFCFAKVAEFRRDNPAGLAADVLALLDAFLKEKEATDGTKSLPAPDQSA